MESVAALLQSIGMEKFLSVFEDNEIDEHTIRLLGKDELQVLLPGKVGPQLKIFQKIQELKNEETMLNSQEIQHEGPVSVEYHQSVCFQCLSVFCSPKLLWKQLVHVHSITQNCKLFVCLNCGSEFNIMWSFKRHILRCHLKSSGTSEQILTMDIECRDESSDHCSSADEMDSSLGLDSRTPIIGNSRARFLSSLQSLGKIPLNVSLQLIESSSKLIQETLNQVKKVVTKHCDETTLARIELEIQDLDLASPFSKFDTQYKFEKFLTDAGLLIKPREMILNDSQIWESRASGSQKQTYDYLYYIPLRETISKLLGKNEILQEILKTKDLLAPAGFRTSFRVHEPDSSADLGSSEIVVNILVFNDDLVVCNPLGASKGLHKLNMTYFQIMELPNEWNSKLKFMFLLSVTKSENVKSYGANSIQKFLTAELKELWEVGISVDSETYKGRVKVKLVQVTGDNLGIQSMLGFSEVFVANRFCRWCKMHRNETHFEVSENISLLRTKENYVQDLSTNDFSKTGIQFDSALNQLEYFHVTQNKCPDIMHDILEGIALHDLRLFFCQLTSSLKISLLTIQRLVFSYKFPFGNKSKATITESFLNGGSTGLTASQTLHLIFAVPLIFGHMIPKGDKFFELIHILLEITQIVLSPIVSDYGHLYLGNVIERHHLLYLELSGQTLKPKHHHLTHYPSALKSLGPLKQFWSMRFEAKHRLAKSVMHVSRNFCNVPKSVAKRFTLDFANFLIQETEPGILLSKIILASVKSLNNSNMFINLNYKPNDKITVVIKLEWNGISLKNGDVLISEWKEDGPTFVNICNIFVHNNVLMLICKEYRIVSYSSHFCSYIVKDTQKVYCEQLTKFKYGYKLTESTSLDSEDSNTYISLPFKIV